VNKTVENGDSKVN